MRIEKWYSGDISRAESGEDETYSTDRLVDVLNMVRSLKDGDAMTVNVSEREGWEQ